MCGIRMEVRPLSQAPEPPSAPDAAVASIAPALLPLYRGSDLAAYSLVDPDVKRALTGVRAELDHHGYAVVHLPTGRERLHRYVLGLRRGNGYHGHHVNAERLDNRRANLRIVSPTEHAIEHGMRPRYPAAPQPAHPANDRGLVHWLDDYRAADGPKHEVEHVNRSKALPKTLTAEEVERLMAMPNLNAPTGLRDRGILMLMHRCGLRVSEACGLYLRDVNWREGTIHIRPEVGKGGREAVVYMDAATQAMLERWKERRRDYAAGKPHLFTTLRGGPIDRKSVYKMVVRRARKAGIDKHVHPHMLRHTFATDLLREGFNIREVQTLLRHADIRTTALYTHVFDSELQEKIRARA